MVIPMETRSVVTTIMLMAELAVVLPAAMLMPTVDAAETHAVTMVEPQPVKRLSSFVIFYPLLLTRKDCV